MWKDIHKAESENDLIELGVGHIFVDWKKKNKWNTGEGTFLLVLHDALWFTKPHRSAGYVSSQTLFSLHVLKLPASSAQEVFCSHHDGNLLTSCFWSKKSFCTIMDHLSGWGLENWGNLGVTRLPWQNTLDWVVWIAEMNLSGLQMAPTPCVLPVSSV